MEGIENKNKKDDILDSSYEMFTPIKTRARSRNKVMDNDDTPSRTHTRSGRQIKKIRNLDYDFESEIDKSYNDPVTCMNGVQGLTPLKKQFGDLRLSSEVSTPSKRRGSARKCNSPKGGFVSPDVAYSKSGRKIKRIEYKEFESDLDISINKISDLTPEMNRVTKDRSDVIHSPIEICRPAPTTPKSKELSNFTHTRSGRRIKKKQYFDDSFEFGKSTSPRNLNHSPARTKTNLKTPTKLVAIENISPSGTFTRSGRKIKKKDGMDQSGSESEMESEDSDGDTDVSRSNIPAIIKPSALYNDENAVEKHLFGFHTPKHRNAMLDKASRSASKLNSMQKTPKSSLKQIHNDFRTPYNMRKKIQRGIVKEVSRQSIDALLEDSGSDYIPSSNSSSDESEETMEDSESSDTSEHNEISGVVPLETPIEDIRNKLIKRKTRSAINNFMFTAEDYFENKNFRLLTSNHTLSQLKTPRFNQYQLAELLQSIGSKHEQAIQGLSLENEAMFTRWLLSLNEGFSILVYGVGSKKKLLNNFHRQFLSRCYVAVINGYFPALGLKDILDCITNDVLKLRSVPTQPHDLVEFIGTKLRNKNNRLFILVHNIDGASLRCDKIQSILSHLAADPNVYLVASLDHINSPLLWDQNKLSLFNFTWEDGTSFLPYTDETSYESSLMVQQSGGIALSGLKNIFKSLNTNSRKIFNLLLEHQLGDNAKKSQGMLFSDLYRECRNSFLVSSDLALRTQLTEFFDHQLVKWKKDNEHLIIPLDIAVLKQFHRYFNNED